MAYFWQFQKLYVQVTALRPLAKALRSTSITPDSPAKLCQTIPRFTTRGRLRAKPESRADHTCHRVIAAAPSSAGAHPANTQRTAPRRPSAVGRVTDGPTEQLAPGPSVGGDPEGPVRFRRRAVRRAGQHPRVGNRRHPTDR